MSNEGMLRDAIEAVNQERYERARDILTRLLRQDQNNPVYWLWMSAAVQSHADKLYCLQNVLRSDPQNQTAKQGLALLDAETSPVKESIKLSEHKKWAVDLKLPSNLLINEKQHRKTQRIIYVVAGLLIFSLILLGGYKLAVPKPPALIVFQATKTPGLLPTYTPTPTLVGYVAQSTEPPIESDKQPTPLWGLLPATYTPTPIYINTPHPISEAYRAGMLAFQQTNWDTAANYFEQASQAEPGAADIAYYLAESQRQAGNSSQALLNYQKAMQVNPDFAPAYLGRALIRISLGKEIDGLKDLNQALKCDPKFAEAYLERAKYYYLHDQFTEAEDDLNQLAKLAPYSPLPHLWKAKIALQKAELNNALEESRQAYDLDHTLLDTYQTYGQAALLNQDYELARAMLQIYLQYSKKDGFGWYLYGRALAELGNTTDLSQALMIEMTNPEVIASALKAFQKAEINHYDQEDFRLFRSSLYLGNQEGQEAINDLINTRSYVLQFNKTNPISNIWFAYNIGLGRAFFYTGRNKEAISQLNMAESIAKDQQQQAIVYFWRALVYEREGQPSLANRDWSALSRLPESIIPDKFKTVLSEKQFQLTPSPAPSATPP